MNLHYLVWAFKRCLVGTLLYVITCLVLWVFLGERGGWVALSTSVATWLIYFSVYVKDRRTDQRYYNEYRDRFI